MDRLELARRLFGDGVEGTSTFHPAETQTYIGKAVSDSANGLVRVDIGNSTTEDGEEGIEVATTVSVKEGEEVYVTAVGGTVAKSYYVSGVVGLGDETNSRITAIETDYVKATMLEADLAEIGVLTADSAVISELQAETAKVENVTAAQLEASTAYIGALQTGNVTAQNIIADKAKLAQIDTSQISADHAVINALDSNYAKIDLANVSNAWIDDGVIRDAAIGDAQIADISANKLTAGTINGSVINVTNLNATNITTGTINGQRLGEGSIALSKLSESVYTEGEVDSIVNNLNDRIDSAIETWTATAVPTLSNYPASSWDTDDEKAEHVGDICYVLNAGSETDGYTYRFAYDNSTGTYQWVLIKDNQVTAALQRLVDAEGDIDGLQSFQSDTSVWISDTDEALNVIRSNHTSLTTVVNKTIVETVQLWYSKANTTAPAKPTSQVTSTSTGGGAWRTVVPSYSTSYPNYFYCYQWKYADGTYGWSSVTRDIAMGEAQSTSRTAASDASTAKSDAATAVSTANTASTNASTAMSDASTAKTNAETAISTANSASSTATAAASDASTAMSDAASAVTTANSNIKSNVQLWYTKQTSTAPSKPSAHVTRNSASTPNAWNLAVPTYNATYPHYFYCYEYQLGDGTYGWTNVVYDSAMTESQERARTAVSDAAAAQSTANSASTAASAAQSAADSAATAAGNAQATANKNVKTSIQLWYTKDNETAPAKPTAKVTSNSTSGGGWRIVVPSYNASYPKYFYCYQYELADGTYTWSDVVFDRATTENEANAHSALTQLTTKVDTQTFNDLSDTVSEHTRNITTLTTTTQQMTQKIDNIGVGGRNLIWDSTWKCTTSNSRAPWTIWGTPPTREVVTIDGKRWLHVVSNAAFQGWQQNEVRRNGFGEIKGGEDVTLSFVARVASATTFAPVGIHWRKNDGTIISQVWATGDYTTDAVRFVKTYSVPNGAEGFNIMIGSNVTGVETWISDLQLEKGNIATDWTPAPEDSAANANPNLSPFFSHDLSDIYSATTNPDGYWYSATAGFTALGDGWAHYEHDNSSGTGAYWASLVAGADTSALLGSSRYTLLAELRNMSGSIDVYPSSVHGTSVWSDESKVRVEGDVELHHVALTKADLSSASDYRTAMAIPAGSSASFDLRISLYEGVYTGPYKPYVDQTVGTKLVTVSNTVNTVSQKADSNIQKISNLTTTLGTNADGTTNVNDIVHRESALEQDLDGFKSTVSETYATKTEVRRTDTGSGTVITSDDAANLPPLSLTVHGKSVQDGTPTPSAPVEIQSVEPYNLLDLGEITFTRFKKVELGETFPTGQYVFSADIDTDYTGKTFRVLFYNGNAEAGGWYLTATNGRISGQVYPTSSFDAIGLYAGYNYSEAGGHTATYTNIQLEVGGTEHRYQPKGEIVIRINGKNLFDKDNPNAIAAYVNSAGAMVSSTPDLSAVIPVIGGETYTVSGTKVQLSGTSADDWACAAFQVRPTAGSQGTVMFYNKYNSNSTMPQTFTVPSNCSYIALKYANTSRVDATATAATIQLEYGSTATDYEDYSPQTAFIDLQGNALRSLPDGTEDTLEVDGEGNAVLVKRSEETLQAVTDGVTGTVGVDVLSATGEIANGVQVMYKLATPQTIPLGKIDLPYLPSPSFSLHVDATVSPTLDAEWWTQGGEEVGSVYQRTSALEQDAEGLSVRMRGLETDAVRKSKDEWTAWLDVGTDSDNNPFLAMGQSGNDLNSRLSNESMGFYNGTEELMKLSGAEGVKADTVRTKRVYIGSWILEELDSGDMAIKLVGGGA